MVELNKDVYKRTKELDEKYKESKDWIFIKAKTILLKRYKK
jgi:hypothetical protein